MSILIRGMQMPKNCETCELSSTDSSGFFGCCVTGNIVMRKREQDRPSWCPLIEVPKHGRLIDADALMKSIASTKATNRNAFGVYMLYRVIADAVKNAPTIIEAEEEE